MEEESELEALSVLMMLRKSMALLYCSRLGVLSEAVRSRHEKRTYEKRVGRGRKHRKQFTTSRISSSTSAATKRRGRANGRRRSSAGKRKDEAIPGPVTCTHFSFGLYHPQTVFFTLRYTRVFTICSCPHLLFIILISPSICTTSATLNPVLLHVSGM